MTKAGWVGPFLPVGCGGGGAGGGACGLCPESGARIVLWGFSYTSLVVSILVYGCHLFVVALAVLGELLMVPVGTVSFLAWGGLLRAVGEGFCGLRPNFRPRRAPHLPRFILLGSFTDILLVVSILDCHF